MKIRFTKTPKGKPTAKKIKFTKKSPNLRKRNYGHIS
jgi:hypothetical protein